ncbi:MAG TPA: DUF6600 domain-containing protein [Chitinivibrionales bacterium]|nr:DUF6600 domain-containing protein [Chitinivibrionales bacterium]
MRILKILFITAACGAVSLVHAQTQVDELIKLKQSGVDDDVLIAYVQSAPPGPALNADDIVVLRGAGISNAVIAEALRHAHAKPPAGQSAVESTAPQPQENVDQTEFEEALNPYGSWVWIDGVRYWRPAAEVGNPGWAPYMSSGHWVYTDLGWTWVSDYPWGWAPFHYGRWLHHGTYGWVWWPDVTWGPAWVRWRTGDEYCGWAPLPPFTVFVPNHGFFYHGRFVPDDFEFGLAANDFFFVPSRHFCDKDVFACRLDIRQRHIAYKKTVYIRDNYAVNNGRVIGRGPSADFVARVTRTVVRPLAVETRVVEKTGPHFRGITVSAGKLVVERPRVAVKVPLASPPSGSKATNPPHQERAAVNAPRDEGRPNRQDGNAVEKTTERKSPDANAAPRQNEKKQEGKDEGDREHRDR